MDRGPPLARWAQCSRSIEVSRPGDVAGVDAVAPSRGLQSALSTFILQHFLPPAGRAAIAPGSSFHIDDYRDSHSKDRRRILNIIGPGPSAYSHTPTEWRQTFAEAQLPYAKIMEKGINSFRVSCPEGSYPMVFIIQYLRAGFRPPPRPRRGRGYAQSK